MSNRIILKVKYEDRELAKSLGAKWDSEGKYWYADNYSNLKIIQKWFPPETKIKKVELSDFELYEKFTRIPSRFKNGQEILKYLGLDQNRMKKTSGFCPMCDSTYTNEWTIDKIEIWHTWGHPEYSNPRIYLTKKEEFILNLYLEEVGN